MNNPALTIIAGVNGSRKTTFALDYFKNSHATFINADLIVIGISSNTPDLSQFRVVNLCLLRLKNILKDNLIVYNQNTMGEILRVKNAK